MERKHELGQCKHGSASLTHLCIGSRLGTIHVVHYEGGDRRKSITEETFTALATLFEEMEDLKPGRLLVIEQVLQVYKTP